MSTITEMAEVHAARIAERDATIASQAAQIERLFKTLIANQSRLIHMQDNIRVGGNPAGVLAVLSISISETRLAFETLQPKEGK